MIIELPKKFNYGSQSKIEDGILNGSASSTLEDSSNFVSGDARCSVRVFERYSLSGQNRVSLSVTLFQNGNEPIRISAITSGGSQAAFFKINTKRSIIMSMDFLAISRYLSDLDRLSRRKIS